jgi:hypothetical protein
MRKRLPPSSRCALSSGTCSAVETAVAACSGVFATTPRTSTVYVALVRWPAAVGSLMSRWGSIARSPPRARAPKHGGHRVARGVAACDAMSHGRALARLAVVRAAPGGAGRAAFHRMSLSRSRSVST